MRAERDLFQLLSFQIELPYTAASVPDVNPPAGGIVTEVIGVISVLDGLEELERRTVKDLYGAVLGTCNVQASVGRDVKNTLRLSKTRDRMRPFSGLEVDHLDGIVAKRGDKQAAAPQVQRHVVNASLHFRQLNGLLKPQRFIGLSPIRLVDANNNIANRFAAPILTA